MGHFTFTVDAAGNTNFQGYNSLSGGGGRPIPPTDEGTVLVGKEKGATRSDNLIAVVFSQGDEKDVYKIAASDYDAFIRAVNNDASAPATLSVQKNLILIPFDASTAAKIYDPCDARAYGGVLRMALRSMK